MINNVHIWPRNNSKYSSGPIKNYPTIFKLMEIILLYNYYISYYTRMIYLCCHSSDQLCTRHNSIQTVCAQLQYETIKISPSPPHTTNSKFKIQIIFTELSKTR